MTWFQELTGFAEASADSVRSRMVLDGGTLTSTVNGRSMKCGHLELPMLGQLRARVSGVARVDGELRVREIIGDIRDLHADPANAGATFQVASQFNLLEMVSPDVTPEAGVGIYENDPTQGPACAIACGAGTIYRNYFAPVDGKLGQSEHRQIDCLADLGTALGNNEHGFWEMRNGYALASAEGLKLLDGLLFVQSEAERDELRSLLRAGIQSDTEVTLHDAGHTVSQVYCSALPVSYTDHPAQDWADFARLVLEAAYESTFLAAILNLARTGDPRLYLTWLGGGAFGNRAKWIEYAVRRSMEKFRHWPLQVGIVSYRRSKPAVQQLLDS
jgi:hypothetical protein